MGAVSDVWAFGIMLFEALAGKHPLSDIHRLTADEIVEKVGSAKVGGVEGGTQVVRYRLTTKLSVVSFQYGEEKLAPLQTKGAAPGGSIEGKRVHHREHREEQKAIRRENSHAYKPRVAAPGGAPAMAALQRIYRGKSKGKRKPQV